LINIVHPREKFSLGLINIPQQSKGDKKSMSLKLKWTNSHNLSFLGLVDVSPLSGSNLKQGVIKLSDLRHSENKKINKKDLENEGVELTPGQFVNLEFSSKKEVLNPNQKVSFVLKSKGYYTPF